MRKIYLFTLVLMFGVGTSVAQISSVKVSPSTENLGGNGVFYSLPRTVFKVDVLISKIEDVPGPYASLASKVLGLTDFINRAETQYSIKGIYIHSISEADPNAIYFLNFGERSNKSDRTFIVQLQANGVLKGINETTFLNKEDRKAKLELREDYFSQDFNYFADLNQMIRVDTIIRRIAVDTTTIEDVVFNRTTVEKTKLQRAQDAANAYMDIHKNRLELLSGFQEVNYPAQTIELMNSELRQMEGDYLALFKGKRFISEEKFSFYVVPDGEKSHQTYPVFKFSKEKGVRDLTATSGERINLIVQTNGLMDVLPNPLSENQSLGVFYRIPEVARVWVEYNNTEYSKNTFLIPQLGVLQSVNTSKTLLSVDPNTGMLKAIEIK
ncbi:MAG: hypothetical protein DRI74_03290 [Bacteroidetes bacterium]|nr:MAG: hypothetical protein DRI74_03290 [Bacteroidota bacterium]